MIGVESHTGDGFSLDTGVGISDGYKRGTGVGSTDRTEAIILTTLWLCRTPWANLIAHVEWKSTSKQKQ